MNPEINVDIHIVVILIVFKSPNQFEFSFVCFVTIAAIKTEHNALFHYIPWLGNECTYEAYCTCREKLRVKIYITFEQTNNQLC